MTQRKDKMKLKTLKDIENKICACGSHKESHNPHYSDDFELKQEAIKDIKFFESTEPKKDGWVQQEAIIKYIKWKFNITKKDLI